jgi:hypothetical protein
MPYFPEELMPLTKKRNSPGVHPGLPLLAKEYNKHDEEIRAIEEFLLGLTTDELAVNDRVINLVGRVNRMLLRTPALVMSGHAISGTQMRFPRTNIAFLPRDSQNETIGPAFSDTTIKVDSTEGFPAEGVITILNDVTEDSHGDESGPSNVEWIKYRGKTSTAFLNCERGHDGSTIGSHSLWQKPQENGCPMTPLATVRPICPPSIVIRPYVFDLFGLEGDIEEIENDIAQLGPTIALPEYHPDYAAFREGMGSVTPDPVVAEEFGATPASSATALSSNGLLLENFAVDFSANKFKFLEYLDEPVGTKSVLSNILASTTPRWIPSSTAAYNLWRFALTQQSDGSNIFLFGAGGGLLRRRTRRRTRVRGPSRMRATYRTSYSDDPITFQQAWNIFNGLTPHSSVTNVEAELFKFVRAAGEHVLTGGSLRSQDPAKQADGKLTFDEARTVMGVAVDAGLVRLKVPVENRDDRGVPVFLGKVDVSHSLSTWSFRDREIEGRTPPNPRVIQYADGTLFCYLGEDDNFGDVGQSVVSYRTWIQPL